MAEVYHADGVIGYCRLSRNDEKEKGISIEDKLKIRREVLIMQAGVLGFHLTHAQIVSEVKSGGSLEDRPGLLSIIDRCAHGEIHTLIIFDIDRLTRDVGDWKRIEKALFKGRVRLVTSRGSYEFTPNFEPAMLQILAVLGEKERRSVSYRRKATNVQRARQAVPSVGYAPYGYRWDTAARRYFVDPEEYQWLEYIFRRIWHVGACTIARELNDQQITPPGMGKRERAAIKWLSGTILNMVRNPFYSGKPAKRKETDMEGDLLTLPRAQWTWADADEIRYSLPPDPDNPNAPQWEVLPHPVTFTQWEQLQDMLPGRTRGGPPTKGLLTGLLLCSNGRKMHLHRPHYECVCENHGIVHKGHSIKQPPLDALITGVVADVIDNLPVSALKTRPKAADDEAGAISAELARVKRQLREKEDTLNDLVARAGFYQSLPRFGPQGHADTLQAVSKEAEALAARLAELESRQQQPSLRLASPLLLQVQQRGGAKVFFAEAPVHLQREVIHFVVKGVRLEPVKAGGVGGMTRAVEVTLYPLQEGKGEEVRHVPIVHPAKGTRRGPYLWRKKQAGNAESEPENGG